MVEFFLAIIFKFIPEEGVHHFEVLLKIKSLQQVHLLRYRMVRILVYISYNKIETFSQILFILEIIFFEGGGGGIES